MATSMLVTDVWDNSCRWQFWGVSDRFENYLCAPKFRFCHQCLKIVTHYVADNRFNTSFYKPLKDRRKDASVKVEEDWEIVREIEFNQLAPLRTSDLPEAEDLYECGSVETYDLGYDRITPKVRHKNHYHY